jgi:spore germination cell wall hydrolase CwlJ-like protein
MIDKDQQRLIAVLAVVCASAALGGCSTMSDTIAYAPATDERECLTRAMYFESNRSSDDGLRAVGTVVVNRTASPKFPHTICGVVGQSGQFASGVLTKPMRPDEEAHVAQIADQVLAGQREPAMGDAMYFHQAGLHFGYSNMHYVLVAGGNAFYEKRSTPSAEPAFESAPVAVARVYSKPTTISDIIALSNSSPPQSDDTK